VETRLAPVTGPPRNVGSVLVKSNSSESCPEAENIELHWSGVPQENMGDPCVPEDHGNTREMEC
jgi:hypothetical protein